MEAMEQTTAPSGADLPWGDAWNNDEEAEAMALSFLQISKEPSLIREPLEPLLERSAKVLQVAKSTPPPNVAMGYMASDEGASGKLNPKTRKALGSVPRLPPSTWLAVGPIVSSEDFTDPLTAFGGIQKIAAKASEALKGPAQQVKAAYLKERSSGHNHTEALKVLDESNSSQFNASTQSRLESFPAEYGPVGRTVWAVAFTSDADDTVTVNMTNVVPQAGTIGAGKVATQMPSMGWAFGDFHVSGDNTTVLIRCTSYFMLDKMKVMFTPDIYEDGRSLHVFHLSEGTHRIFVRFMSPSFVCDMFEDSMASREAITGVSGQNSKDSPLIILPDIVKSDVVAGMFPSPYLGIPVQNAAKNSVMIESAELTRSPTGLSVELIAPNNGKEMVPIASGQAFILPLKLNQSANVTCTDNKVNLTVVLTPADENGEKLPPSTAHFTADCWATRVGGYRVTYPDFDSSIQDMWVAPPDLTKLKNGRCLQNGCPIMLSLHGSGVVTGPTWGHSYALEGTADDGHPFPYPAWLVQPSNRYQWGTDWEVQGYDNALAALDFVAKTMPGLTGDEERSSLSPDLDRLLITGHSMGGHGCLVFTSHEPDRLLGSACAAPWTSQRRYIHENISPLADKATNAVMQSRMAEHDADFLSSNFRGVPFKVVYGELDEDVPPTEPRYMQLLVDYYSNNATAAELGELPDTPHWFGQQVPELVSFFEQHLRQPTEEQDYALPALPGVFEFKVASASSFGTKGNLKLLQLFEASRPASFYVRRCANDVHVVDGSCGDGELSPTSVGETTDGDALWYIDTDNVRRFSFAQHLVRGRPLPRSLVLDGQTFNQSKYPSLDSEEHWCLAKRPSEGNPPHWTVCKDGSWKVQRGGSEATSGGTLSSVLRGSPVCIVHSDLGTQKTEATYLANKMYFISRYAVPIVESSASGTPELPQYCSDANLIFIGDPAENALLNANACAFPYVRFHTTENAFSLAGIKYLGTGLGLMALGRLQNGHMAVVLDGTDEVGRYNALARLPVGAFIDSSDFLVIGPDAAWEGLGGMLASGYLDPLWKVSAIGSWARPMHSVQRWLGTAYDGVVAANNVAEYCEARKSILELSDKELQDSFAGHVVLTWWLTMLIASISFW